MFMPGAFRMDSASTLAESVASAWRFWLMIILALVVAYMSNPTDASFRTFLTDLSFHLHLRRLRSSTSSNTAPASDSHVLTFSNRISIQLKTPAYIFRSFGLFSTVTISASSHGYAGRGTSKATADQEEGGLASFGSKSAFFVGAFGHWWAWEDGAVDDNEAVKDRLASSVITMESLDQKVHQPGDESPTYFDEKEELVLPGDIKAPLTTPRKALRPVKAEFRAGQRRASPTIKSPRDRTVPASTSEVSSPGEAIAEAKLAAALAEKKVSLLTAADSGVSTTEAASPAAKDTPEVSIDQAITTLQKQIQDAKSASTEVQAKLQAELDELKAQKKEDDRIRSEAKARTRVLEEAKRLAEIDRLEADKKRNLARQSRQSMLDHIERMKAEVARLERKELDHERKARQNHSDCLSKIAQVKEELERKKELVHQAETALRKVTTRVEALEHAIEERKTELHTRRQQAWTQAQQRSISNPSYYGTAEAPYTHWVPVQQVESYSTSPPVSAQEQYGYALSKAETLPAKTSFLEHRLWHNLPFPPTTSTLARGE